MAKPSAAILCIAMGEQPFAEEWLEYHLGLGFEHVYYIITDADFKVAHKFYSQTAFGGLVSWHHFDQNYVGWQLGAYCQFLSRFAEDWLMVLDLDEFLYLPEGETVGDYLAALDQDIGQVQFPWLIAPLQDYLSSSVLGALKDLPKFANNHVKSIVRRENLVSIGIHSHQVRGAETVLSSGKKVTPDHYHDDFVRGPEYYQSHACVLHAVSRGHLDIMNRICSQRFNDAKCGEEERSRLRMLLTGPPEWSTLPNRYLLQKVLQSFPRVELNPMLPLTSNTTNQDLLQEIFLRQINQLVDFPLSPHDNLPAVFESRYALDQKLDRLDVSPFVDIEQYLRFSNQSDYVIGLRKVLEAGVSR